MNDFLPLSEDEHALLRHVTRWGSSGYPVERIGRRWVVRDWRTVKGPPTVYRTKREAVAQFERWLAQADERHAAEAHARFMAERAEPRA